MATTQHWLTRKVLLWRGGAGSDSSDDDDLSPDGAVAQRIRAELAAHVPLPDERFVIASTSDGRGMGLFVGAAPIEAGSYLFDYEGRILEQAEFDLTYPHARRADGPHADYAVGIEQADGDGVYVDAASPDESNIARYMNHADAETANCAAWTLAHPMPRVLIFAQEELAPGVELVWDYGRDYWEGREDEKT